MTDENELDEYSAACQVRMSPKLLRWLSKYSPKQQIDRKLPIARQEGSVNFYKLDELVEFDLWLREPWPSKNGARPNIPTGIKNEIKEEASYECAICRSQKNSCEVAHIEPIHHGKNNHPENLIYLCANHHTKFDKGLYGPNKNSEDIIKSFKSVLLHYQLALWSGQGKTIEKIYSLLSLLDKVECVAKRDGVEQYLPAFSNLARKAIFELKNISDSLPEESCSSAVSEFKKELQSIKNDSETTESTVAQAPQLRRRMAEVYGFVDCPLCEGRGLRDGDDCPVCHGDKQIEQRFAERVDLGDFELVDCPLCEGRGLRDGDDCPVCHGDKQIEQRFAERVDLSDFELVDCPICEGSGTHNGNDCPECGGEKKMEQHYADRVDLSNYELVDCPLCEGSGTHNGNDCPECGGEKKMEQRYADRVDLSIYELIDCSLCEGSGTHNGNDCPRCDGEQRLERRQADYFDNGGW